MPTAEYLPGISDTRHLARSLLYEVLGLKPESMPTPPPPNHNTRWTRDGIFDAVLRFIDANDRMPTYQEWQRASENNLPSRATVQLQWGKISVLLEAVRAHMRKGT